MINILKWQRWKNNWSSLVLLELPDEYLEKENILHLKLGSDEFGGRVNELQGLPHTHCQVTLKIKTSKGTHKEWRLFWK